jgi:hypothetical protein
MFTLTNPGIITAMIKTETPYTAIQVREYHPRIPEREPNARELAIDPSFLTENIFYASIRIEWTVGDIVRGEYIRTPGVMEARATIPHPASTAILDRIEGAGGKNRDLTEAAIASWLISEGKIKLAP